MNPRTNNLASQILRAALSKFEADRQNALATLDIYLYDAVAIGDHPNIVEEVTTATKKLAEAEEAIQALERNFIPKPTQEDDEDDE